MEKIKSAYYQSPAGEMILGSYAGSLCVCDWISGKSREGDIRRVCRCLNAECEEGMSETIGEAMCQLDEYFSGNRMEFSVPLLFTGTPFQCRVWTELMNISYGDTISYGEFARRIGNPKAVRAVGLANAANPISIFVPCHRVVGSGGKLTGYGGGLDVKQYLLSLEARTSGKVIPLPNMIFELNGL